MPLTIFGSPLSRLIQSCIVTAAIAVALPDPAKAGWNVVGQPADPDDGTDGRVNDGAVFTVLPGDPNQFQFRVDSSLDQTKWWVSGNPSIWGEVVTSPGSDDFPGMRVDENLSAGQSFYAGMSFENALSSLKHSFRIRYGDDNTSGRPPDGTLIYIGYTNIGTPSGIGEANVSMTGGTRLINARPLDPVDSLPPASAFPPAFVNNFSWLGFTQEYGYLSQPPGPGNNYGADNANTTRIVVEGDANQAVTELVVVMVLPDDAGLPLAGVEDNRMHFSWTIDAITGASPADVVGGPNPNFQNGVLLAPEPGRTTLIAFALALLLLRRSRPR